MTAPTIRQPFAPESAWEDALAVAYGHGLQWLEPPSGATEPAPDPTALLQRLDRPLPTRGLPAPVIMTDLVRDLTTGRRRSDSTVSLDRAPLLPVGVATDWLTTIWKATTPHTATSPAVTALERVTGRWILNLFQLPNRSEVSVTADRQTAQLQCLATAHRRVLQTHGHGGTEKARPSEPVILLVGNAHHRAADTLFQDTTTGGEFLIETLDSDSRGRMSPQQLRNALGRHRGPVVVCARAGHLESEASDPLAAITAVVEADRSTRAHDDLWLHIDGGQGLWAAISPALRHHVDGYERADSWALDTDTWLSTPRQCGLAVVREDRERPYSPETDVQPAAHESGESIRAIAMYAAIRHTGRHALMESAERIGELTLRMVRQLTGHEGVTVLNRSVLNRVFLRCTDRTGDFAIHTPAVLAAIQEARLWRPVALTPNGKPAIQLTLRNWLANESDVDRATALLLDAHHRLRDEPHRQSPVAASSHLAQYPFR